jgi:hypothetical protein
LTIGPAFLRDVEAALLADVAEVRGDSDLDPDYVHIHQELKPLVFARRGDGGRF